MRQLIISQNIAFFLKKKIQAGMKAEDILDPDALQAHINGMNSYMYNHTVESWM